MKTNYEKLQSQSITLAIYLSISLLVPNLVTAEEDDSQPSLEELGLTLKSLSKTVIEAEDDKKNEYKILNEKIKEIETHLQNKDITIKDAQLKVDMIEEKLLLGLDKQAELQKKYNEMDENFGRYVFQNRAQKIVPIIYAIAAIQLTDKGSSDKLLYGLAGYGLGSLVENTGYGISRAITFFKYDFIF